MAEQKVVNKKTFEVDIDGKKVELAVVRPNYRVQERATLVYNRAFREAVSPGDGKPGALVRQRVEKVLREQNLWDDDKQNRYELLTARLLDGERKLGSGGIKLSEAKALAIQMRRDRWERQQLLAGRNELEQHTAEAQAEQAKFNFYVASCTVYADTGKPYYRDADDYLSRENDPANVPAATNLSKMLFGLDDEFEHKLPENRFLLKYGFCNDKLHLVRKGDGKLVDAEGRLVDDKGRLVNEDGQLVDADGNLLTEDGEYKVEFKEFIDDTVEAPAAQAAA